MHKGLIAFGFLALLATGPALGETLDEANGNDQNDAYREPSHRDLSACITKWSDWGTWLNGRCVNLRPKHVPH